MEWDEMERHGMNWNETKWNETGMKKINFSGGEPFTKPKWLGEMVKYCKEELKLEFYSLFKQATEGDVATKKPSIFDMVAFAKWTAWDKLRGLTTEQAMEKYIARVEEEYAA